MSTLNPVHRKTRIFILAALGVLAVAEAQKNCVKGIPCGGSCISANYTCRIGTPTSTAPASAAPATTTGTPGTGWIFTDNTAVTPIINTVFKPGGWTIRATYRLPNVTNATLATTLKAALQNVLPDHVMYDRPNNTPGTFVARNALRTKGVIAYAHTRPEGITVYLTVLDLTSNAQFTDQPRTALELQQALAIQPATTSDTPLRVFAPAPASWDATTARLILPLACGAPTDVTITPPASARSLTFTPTVSGNANVAITVTINGTVTHTQPSVTPGVPITVNATVTATDTVTVKVTPAAGTCGITVTLDGLRFTP